MKKIKRPIDPNRMTILMCMFGATLAMSVIMTLDLMGQDETFYIILYLVTIFVCFLFLLLIPRKGSSGAILRFYDDFNVYLNLLQYRLQRGKKLNRWNEFLSHSAGANDVTRMIILWDIYIEKLREMDQKGIHVVNELDWYMLYRQCMIDYQNGKPIPIEWFSMLETFHQSLRQISSQQFVKWGIQEMLTVDTWIIQFLEERASLVLPRDQEYLVQLATMYYAVHFEIRPMDDYDEYLDQMASNEKNSDLFLDLQFASLKGTKAFLDRISEFMSWHEFYQKSVIRNYLCHQVASDVVEKYEHQEYDSQQLAYLFYRISDAFPTSNSFYLIYDDYYRNQENYNVLEQAKNSIFPRKLVYFDRNQE